MKNIFTILLLISLLFVNTSCDSYLDVNTNVDAPDYIDETLYLAGIQSAYAEVYYDLRAVAPLAQMMGTSSYTSFATNYYSAASDAAGQVWRMTYWTQGYNLENLINQSIANESWTLAGIGLAMKAYSWDMTTKYHGDLPLKEAYVPGLLSHKYDGQDTVFAQVRRWAEEAISYLEMADKTAYGTKLKTQDLIYGGDASKWIKFAHGVIVRNLSALTNKSNFVSEYADELIYHAERALSSVADDATVLRTGGAGEVSSSSFNNFWGAYRANLTNSYWQHDYIVQVMTGTVPMYDETTGDKVLSDPDPETGLVNSYRKFKLAPKQIISDTTKVNGAFDPRIVAKLATGSDASYKNIGVRDSVSKYTFIGSSFTGTVGPTGTAPNFYGRYVTVNSTYDGIGRWLYRDNAPYILMTAAELQFCLAETQWKKGNKAAAFEAFKNAVSLDIQFTAKYLDPGSYVKVNEGEAEVVGGGKPGGDKITKALYNELANEYLDGPYVAGLSLSDFSLSHIMMQKYVALFPWGAHEAWVDLRKYHYDIDYSGEYPSEDNGWTKTTITQKWDSADNKVFKGFYLAPAQVENRRGTYNVNNFGSPCYRVRPRYNSEYMWNVPSLEELKPISGTAVNYHTSIPWFAYPSEMPTK